MNFDEKQTVRELCQGVSLYFKEKYIEKGACLPEGLTENFLNDLNLYNIKNVETINKVLNNPNTLKEAGLTFEEIELVSPNAFDAFSMMLADDLITRASQRGFEKLVLTSNKSDMLAYYKDGKRDGFTMDNLLNIAGIPSYCDSKDYCTFSITKDADQNYSFKAVRHTQKDNIKMDIDIEDAYDKYLEDKSEDYSM